MIELSRNDIRYLLDCLDCFEESVFGTYWDDRDQQDEWAEERKDLSRLRAILVKEMQ